MKLTALLMSGKLLILKKYSNFCSKFLWYDHLNISFTSWINGQFSLCRNVRPHCYSFTLAWKYNTAKNIWRWTLQHRQDDNLWNYGSHFWSSGTRTSAYRIPTKGFGYNGHHNDYLCSISCTF